MAMKYLGDTIDIHGGGRDLIFPTTKTRLPRAKAAPENPCQVLFIMVC